MPIRHRHRSSAAGVLVPAVLAAAAMSPAWAQDSDGDPGVVITRTVHPRIAYRGVPTDELPIASRASTFPAQVFDRAMGTMLEQVAGDELVQQHGTAGLAGRIGDNLTAPGRLTGIAPMLGADTRAATGRVPLGPGASVGGAISGATGGLADRITSGVSRALVPAAALQGGGP